VLSDYAPSHFGDEPFLAAFWFSDSIRILPRLIKPASKRPMNENCVFWKKIARKAALGKSAR
jgi:hypothetical protein